MVRDFKILSARLGCLKLKRKSVFKKKKRQDIVQSRVTDDELRDRLGLECLSAVMRRGRLRWLGNVERMDNGNWVSGIRITNVGDVANRG